MHRSNKPSYSITSSASDSSMGDGSIPSARGLEVEREGELGRPPYRHVGGILAAQYARRVGSHLVELLANVRAVVHEPALGGELTPRIGGGHAIAGSQSDEPGAIVPEQPVDADVDQVDVLLRHGRKGVIEIARARHFEDAQAHAEELRRGLRVADLHLRFERIAPLDQQRDGFRLRHKLVQELDPLGRYFRR